MRVLQKIILFCAISLGMYVLAVFSLSRLSIGTYPLIYSLCDGLNLKGGNSYQKFKEFDRDQEYDVVILGSSHAYRGYDPRIFKAEGYNAFNLGSSSQTPFNSYFLIEEYLTKENCDLLLLDVFNVALEMDALESSSDLIQNITSDHVAAGMAFSMKDPRALNMYALRVLSADIPPYYQDTTYVGRGFSENRNSAPSDVTYRNDLEWNKSKVQWTYLNRIIKLCKERGIRVVLVDHPSPVETHNARLTNSASVISNFSVEEGVVFLDFSMSLGLDGQEHFYDHTHLNQRGVEKFNLKLIAQLKEKGLL